MNGQETPTLSIVVPVYNEAENVRVLYGRLRSMLDSLGESSEIIFVNDGSTDGTVNQLVGLRREDSSLKVIDLSRNFGKEAAVTAGIDFAAGDAVVVIDADLQDPPELIPELVKKWREGFDSVCAVRTRRDGDPWLKRVTAHFFYRLIGKISKSPIPEDTGDFRLMSRRAVDALKCLREQNRFMKGLFAWVGFPQAAVYYVRDPRFAGRTTWNYWKLWNFAVEGITSFSYAPLQLATFFGLAAALGAFVHAAYIFVSTVFYGNPVPGYPSLMVAVLFLGGVQLICLGIMGEYLARTYSESKRRPLYFVNATLGLDRSVEHSAEPLSGRSRR
jgi:glycosyltransferase involved in cell wall biosynthesis